jgi:hypothetical protein
MAHCLARGILSHHLGSISSAFARTFEATLPALDHPITLPFTSVIVTIVLLNVASTCATPE